MYTGSYNVDVEQEASERPMMKGMGCGKSLKAIGFTTELKWKEPRITTSANALRKHVDVNAAAEYYHLPQLQKLANANIRRLFETMWCSDSFLNAIDDAYKFTDDEELRRLVSTTAADHLEELLDLEAFKAPKVDVDLSLSIMRNLLGKHKAEKAAVSEELRELRRRLEYLELNYASAQRRCDEEAETGERIRQSIKNVRGILLRTKYCRNITCDAEFCCFIEQGGTAGDPNFILRCARCRCKHK